MRTKTEVLTHLGTKAGVKKQGVAGMWELLLGLAIEETKASGQFLLPGIGKIALDRRKARKGRNPQTGQSMIIPPKTTLRFRFLKTFKDAVLSAEVPPKRMPRRRGRKAT
jgi:DNA-binding protein HU-beta